MQKDDLKKLKEQLRAKFFTLYNEAKKDPKQVIVGAVILVVALLLLILAFTGGDKPQEKALPQPEIEKITDVKLPVVKQEIVKQEIDKKKPEKKTEVKAPALEKTSNPAEEAKKIVAKNVVVTFTAQADKDFDYQVFYTVKREVWFDPSHVVTYKAKKGKHKYSIKLPVKEIFRIRLDFGEAPGTVTIKDIYVAGSQFADLNDFTLYNFNQIDSHKINKDNSLTIKATGKDPFMAYERALLAE